MSLVPTDASGGHSKALVDTRLMPPPPVPKKPKVVLEEDEYVNVMEKIIERDFFPDIPKLQNRLEWLEAVRSGDPERIRIAQHNIAVRRAQTAQSQRPTSGASTVRRGVFETPGGGGDSFRGATPLHVGETPLHPDATPGPAAYGVTAAAVHASLATGAAEGAAPPMSLDEFCATYTGEDNAAFDVILERSNERKLKKAEGIFLPKLTAGGPPPRLLENGRGGAGAASTSGNQLALLDSGVPKGQEARPYQHWRHNPRSQLYYGPEGRAPSASEMEARAAAPPKAILHANTRVRPSTEGTGVFTPMSTGATATPAGTTPSGSHPAPSPGGPAAPQQMGPRNAGQDPGLHRLIRTPVIESGAGATPLMTWGDIASTPLRLNPADDADDVDILPEDPDALDGPRFHVAAPSKREELARKLADKSSASLKRKRALSVQRVQAQLTPGRGGAGVPLSEAARALAARVRGRQTPLGGGDTFLRAQYGGGGGGGATPLRGLGSARGTPAGPGPVHAHAPSRGAPSGGRSLRGPGGPGAGNATPLGALAVPREAWQPPSHGG